MNASQLNYHEVGSGNNILVLIHAYPVNNQLFSKLDGFLPRGWRAILPDLPGFGDSSIYADKDVMTMSYMAERINELLPENYENLVIGGVSMGGYVTLAFAEEYPEKAAGYILMNTRDSADEDGGAGRKEVVKKIQIEQREEYINGLLLKLLGKTSLENSNLVTETRSLITTASDEAIIQSSRGMGVRPDRREVMSSLNKPVLLITGDEDVITGPEIMSEMSENYAQAKYVVIPEAGHYAVFEQPVRVASEIESFLSEIT